jgi:hypothetical protein
MYSEYNLYKVFEYIFGILFFVSTCIRVFILNTFKKYFTPVDIWYAHAVWLKVQKVII